MTPHGGQLPQTHGFHYRIQHFEQKLPATPNNYIATVCAGLFSFVKQLCRVGSNGPRRSGMQLLVKLLHGVLTPCLTLKGRGFILVSVMATFLYIKAKFPFPNAVHYRGVPLHALQHYGHLFCMNTPNTIIVTEGYSYCRVDENTEGLQW